MNIELKIRAWDEKEKIMHIPMTLKQIKQLFEASLDGRLGGSGIFFMRSFDDLEFLLYTGLKDKNGKEIYVGDKFNDEYENDGSYYLVVWNKECAQFQLNLYSYAMHTGEGSQEVWDSELSLVDENAIDFDCVTDMEIAGNIYETTNPKI